MQIIRRLIVLIIMLVGFLFVVSSKTSYASQQDATLTDSFYFDPSTSFSPTYGFLRLQGNGSSATLIGILRFNVSTSGGWTIDKARLNLAAGYAGFCTLPSADVRIYSTTDDADPPTRDVLLDTLDSGNTTVPYPGTHSLSAAYQHWSDDGGGALSSYLDAQRQGDGVATLWVETTTNTTGSVYLEGNSGAIDGACGSGAGGSYLIGPPALQLADTNDPTAVHLTTLQSANNTDYTLLLSIGGLLLISTIALIIMRRRQPQA